MTAMMKQSLFPEFDAMEKRFRRLWEGVPFVPAFMPGVTPAADVYETSTEYVVELEVPGYEQKDLGLEISGRTLVITGTLTELTDESREDVPGSRTARAQLRAYVRAPGRGRQRASLCDAREGRVEDPRTQGEDRRATQGRDHEGVIALPGGATSV